MTRLFRTVFCIVILANICSCVNTKNATYFNDLPDSEIEIEVENSLPVIQKNDLLSIAVSSLSPEASQLFNTPNASGSRPGSSTTGYLVDQEGNIQFPILGNIKAAGLTKRQLKEEILKGINDKNLLLDPIVDIRFLNYKVSVLGEVSHPMSIDVPGEKISLLEAIAAAGDLTLYAKRDNVLLIRETEGKKLIRHLDLTDKNIFTSPYYYLKSNDVLYVAPSKARVASVSPVRQWLPMALSIISVVSFAIYRFTR